MSTQEIEKKCRKLRELQAHIEEVQAEAERLRAEIQFLLGDTEFIQVGAYKITWKPVRSMRLDVSALKKALPDVAQAFTRESTTRRFCIA